jgi:hypothetical protein
MEYVKDHGSFADLPYDAIINTFLTRYGDVVKTYLARKNHGGDFEREAQRETEAKQSGKSHHE